MRSLNLARMDLTSLRLVVLCAQAGSLTAAARRAHLSVSGASHRLSELEQSLQTSLFVRSNRGLRPTAAGHLVAEHAQHMLDTLQAMVAGLGGASYSS